MSSKWLLIVILGYFLYCAKNKIGDLENKLVKIEHERKMGNHMFGPDADFGMNDDVAKESFLCRDKNAPCTMGAVKDPNPPTFCTESVCNSKGVCDSIIASCDKTVPAPPPPPPAFDPLRDSCVLNKQQLKDALLIDPHLLQNLPSNVPQKLCDLPLDFILLNKHWESHDPTSIYNYLISELVVLLYNNEIGSYNLDKHPDSIIKKALYGRIVCGLADPLTLEEIAGFISTINEGLLDGYELCSDTYTPYIASKMPLHEYQRHYKDLNPSARFGQFNPTPPPPIFDSDHGSCVLSFRQLQDALRDDPSFFDIFSSNLPLQQSCGISLLHLAEQTRYVGLRSVFVSELSTLLYNDKVGKYNLKDDPSSILYRALNHPEACTSQEKRNEFAKIMADINDGVTKGYNRCSDTYTPEIAARMPLWVYQLNYQYLNPSARSQSIKAPTPPYVPESPKKPKSEIEKLREVHEIFEALLNIHQKDYEEVTLKEFLNSANEHLPRHKNKKEIPETPKKETSSKNYFLGIPTGYLCIMWLLGLLFLTLRP